MMEQWFINEWRAEREANRTFREDVVQRLTALETTAEVEDEAETQNNQARVNWTSIAIAGMALLVSVLALI